jgi:hypothetical protein
MTIRSPFDGLRIPPDLVCEFFAVFSRFEFALKESGYVQKGNTKAFADWNRFANDAATWLRFDGGSAVAEAVEYLTTDPPKIQLATLEWEGAPLGGTAPIENALHAVAPHKEQSLPWRKTYAGLA